MCLPIDRFAENEPVLFKNPSLLEDQLKWIDVDDQLPDAGEDVLIELEGCVVLFGHYRVGFWFVNRPHIQGYMKIIHNKVTKWKPIPKPSMEGIIK